MENFNYIPHDIFEVTKHDTNSINGGNIIGFMVGENGNIKLVPAGSSTAVTIPVIAGIQYTLEVKQVFDTDTTCGTVFGLRFKKRQ